MSVTDSDIDQTGNGTGNDEAPELREGFHNARARDGQRTSSADTLPDTERVKDAFTDWLYAVRDVISRLGNGSFWDEQPPSPRELVERYTESSWAHSDHQVLVVLRWFGCVLSIVWSVPLYGLAIVGQRFGRVAIAIPVIYLLTHLI